VRLGREGKERKGKERREGKERKGKERREAFLIVVAKMAS
jgi:hypothetical protein